MPKFKSILELTIKAATQADANEVAGDAAVHLRETFNDDDSISPGIRYMSGGPENVVIPVALLSALIDAADRAVELEDHDAERNRQDCERDGEKACRERARTFRRAFREARTFRNGAVPKSRAAAKASGVFALVWGGGDEPESPAITLHSTKAKAIEAGVNCMREVDAERDVIARVRRELKADGTSWEGLPNETNLEIQELQIQ